MAFAEDDLPLGSVAAAELLELVPALHRGLGSKIREAMAERSQLLCNLVPVDGAELATL